MLSQCLAAAGTGGKGRDGVVGEAADSESDQIGDYLITLGEGGSNFCVALPGYTWRAQLMNRSVSLAAG